MSLLKNLRFVLIMISWGRLILIRQNRLSINMKLKNKYKFVELSIILMPFLFMSLISAYHAFGEKTQAWKAVWACSHHLLIIGMSMLIGYLLFDKVIKFVFFWVIPAYFSFKCIYYVLCYLNIYIFSPSLWGKVWNLMLIFLLFIFSIILMYRNYGMGKKRLD